jgi:hypothetical protein
VKLALLVLFVPVIEPLDAERPPRSAVSIAFASYSSAPETIGFGDGGQVRVDAIWIAMKDVDAQPVASCKRSSAKPIIAGPLTAELVKRQLTSAETADLEVDRYCAFGLQLRRARGRVSGAPNELRGASIVIVGRRTDGVRFLLRSRLDHPVVLRARELEGFAVSAPDTHWIVGVDLARWMAGVDLALADATGDGRQREVRIDERSNPDLLAAFNANVEAGFALFHDRDGDRSLDVAERAQPIATRQ